MFEDYRFWLGLVGSITGITSLILAVGRERRASRTEQRLDESEKRTLFGESVRHRAAYLLRGCENAASTAKDVKKKSHPEWRDLSVGLEIGKWEDDDCSIVYVRSDYQNNPTIQGQKTLTATWQKWYICLSNELDDLNTFAIFGELKSLLNRSGQIEFELGSSTPKWIRKEVEAADYVGVLFGDKNVY